MVTLTQKTLTFQDFLEQCPDEGSYELVNGAIIAMPPATRNHADVATFIQYCFYDHIQSLNLNWVVTHEATIKTVTPKGIEQGRKPNVGVIDKTVWRSNRRDYSALTDPIQLAVEVTSTDWEDDYLDKRDEYQRLGIPEFWIVDYLGLGSRDLLGNPKFPAVIVFQIDQAGVYQPTLYRGSERIQSLTFPELYLLAEAVLNA